MNANDLKKQAIFTLGDDQLEISKEILSDYLFAGRACSFINPTELEEDIILLYTSKSVSTKKATKLIAQLPFPLEDIDAFFFFAKRLKDAYRYADGIFTDASRPVKQKKLFNRLDNSKEVLFNTVLQDLDFLNGAMNYRKVLYITLESTKNDFNGLNNLEILEVPFATSLEYETWFEWFDLLKMKVMTLDFDVAFVSLGIVSDALCQFISASLHKMAFSKGVKKS